MLSKIRLWLAPPTFEGDEEKSRTASLLNLILWTFIFAALLYGFLAPLEPQWGLRRALIIVTFVFIMLFFKQLVNWGYVCSIGVLVVISLWVLFTVAMFFGADYHNPAFMGYVLVVVCAGLLLDWRAAIGWSLINVLSGAAFLILGEKSILPGSPPTPSFAFWIAPTGYILVSTLLISQSLRKIDEAFAKANYELKERKRVEAMEKMRRLLNELLELSRIGRLVNPPSDTPFTKIVEEALSLTRGRLMAGNIKVNVEKDSPSVRGDRPRLVEVMQNLIDNAAKFMGDQPAPRIEIGVGKESEESIFFVKDNGIGINPAHREKIFGLFDKLDPQSEGTGVGLALVKQIVEVHDGRIWVESEGQGKGSMFCFTLPVKE